ncbi:MAG: low molecular weight phosphotyrosine protein phosphatase [Acidimicrobiales bacterium]|nr:low molecular weight phosphotyrosine protein phosphatase [Acidimicrobiales bacterium]
MNDKLYSLSFVCTGNICRSPMAEVIFNELAHAKNLPYRAQSFGIGPWHVGQDMDNRARRVLKLKGYDPPRHFAKQIKRGQIPEGLLLAMDQSHLRDLNKLVGEIKADIQLGSQVFEKKAMLLMQFASDSKISEVPDPYYGDEEDFSLSCELTEKGCMGLIDRIVSGSDGQ